ncbi:RHS repeat-associated core domain-containing protein [Chryseobacterium gregarium]|uniref:RHS repeat-associated core domain-containing protein n=1 Tax=Chryseobacterium gregarium TaxID=456299 RepID=UPI000404906D|nr:RHS repeat-associated core domain-containing protein [Chryseobacterium gregarium]
MSAETMANLETSRALEMQAFSVEPMATTATLASKTRDLQFFPTEEGFYDYLKDQYIYQYRDHLGNARVNYVKNSQNVPEITDTNNYYAFGMNHIGGMKSLLGGYQNYKYNGKEIQESGMYDYGARFYMPDIGRWGVADPLAETSRRWSPYTYAFNNPIRFIDPDGRQGTDIIFRDNRDVEYKYENGKFYNTSTNKVYTGGNKTLDKIQSTFDKINSSDDKYLKRMISTLEKSDKTHRIQESKIGRSQTIISSDNAHKAYQLGKRVGTGVFLDLEQGEKIADAQYLTTEKTTNSDGATIVHELKHSYDFDQGYMKGESKVDGAESPSEVRGVIMENKYRRIEHTSPRLYYDNVKIDFKNIIPKNEKK